jgi:hypothetical protein
VKEKKIKTTLTCIDKFLREMSKKGHKDMRFEVNIYNGGFANITQFRFILAECK